VRPCLGFDHMHDKSSEECNNIKAVHVMVIGEPGAVPSPGNTHQPPVASVTIIKARET
jgi:hypothetical protein